MQQTHVFGYAVLVFYAFAFIFNIKNKIKEDMWKMYYENRKGDGKTAQNFHQFAL